MQSFICPRSKPSDKYYECHLEQWHEAQRFLMCLPRFYQPDVSRMYRQKHINDHDQASKNKNYAPTNLWHDILIMFPGCTRQEHIKFISIPQSRLENRSFMSAR